MRSSGSYVPVSTVGAHARAFVPAPQPPQPPLAVDSSLRLQLDRSLLALGRLDSIATLLPNPDLFLCSYVRKEAVVSSQIEGTQSSLSDLLLFEIAAAPGVPFDDVVEVSNYVAALAHVQFETTHPFLDGNGRLGRLLVPLILHVDGVLEQPLRYLSSYFKQRREEYYARLGPVRTEGDWEGWLMFVAAGVVEVAERAVATAKQLADLIQRGRERVRGVGRGAPTALQVHEALQREPVTTIPRLVARTRLSVPGATAALERLIALDLVREVTGRQRNRVYSYVSYVSLFSEGTEPPKRGVDHSKGLRRLVGRQGRLSNLGDRERRVVQVGAWHAAAGSHEPWPRRAAERQAASRGCTSRSI